MSKQKERIIKSDKSEINCIFFITLQIFFKVIDRYICVERFKLLI